MKHTQLALTFAKYRLRWYRETMFDQLLRLKHALLIIIVLSGLSPLLLMHLVTQPILAVVSPTTVHWYYFVEIILVQLAYLGWILIQKKAIQPTALEYFSTLPINPRVLYLIDVIVLLVANNLFWIPLFCVLWMPFSSDELTRLVAFAVSIISIQRYWLENKKGVALSIMVLIDLMCYTSMLTSSHIISAFALIIAVFSVAFYDIKLPKLKGHKTPLNFFLIKGMKRFNLIHTFPLPGIQLTILIKQYFIEAIVRTIASLGILMFGYGVVVMGNIANPFPITVLVVSFLMLLWSSFYPLMKASRDSCKAYLKSLPVSNRKWLALDYCVITGISSLFSASFIALLFIEHKMNFLIVFYSLALSLLLGIFLIATRNCFPRQGTWISASLVGLFSVLIILKNNL
jgi:hypothetical protein